MSDYEDYDYGAEGGEDAPKQKGLTAGIDSGSTTTKSVVMRDNQVIGTGWVRRSEVGRPGTTLRAAHNGNAGSTSWMSPCQPFVAMKRPQQALIAETEWLYALLPALAGYSDKLRRRLGAADPGAVPGGSTRTSLPGRS